MGQFSLVFACPSKAVYVDSLLRQKFSLPYLPIRTAGCVFLLLSEHTVQTGLEFLINCGQLLLLLKHQMEDPARLAGSRLLTSAMSHLPEITKLDIKQEDTQQ